MKENYNGHGLESYERLNKNPGMSSENKIMQEANHPGTRSERDYMDRISNPAHYTGNNNKKTNW